MPYKHCIKGDYCLVNKLTCVFSCSCEPGDLYFQSEKLRKWSGATPRSISNFEKIKVVGKGEELVWDCKQLVQHGSN